jgi:ATP-dependent RNA helicase RhlE
LSFATLGLSPKLLQAVTDMGYATPTPIQAAAVPTILQKADLIGIAQTGTGKTAAFVLPLLQRLAEMPPSRHARALIVAPTRELALQIDENVRSLSKHVRVRVATIFGGVNEGPQKTAVRNGVDIIVATPGRLIDLMGSRHVSLEAVKILVLDEADRMLDMGFLPQIRRIVNAVPRERQTLLFSATLSKDIEKITGEFLRSPEKIEIGRRHNPAETVAQFLYPVAKSRKADLLVHLLKDQSMDSVLVFSRTKHGADKIARRLQQSGIDSATIHSNRSQGQRVAALNAFKTGRCRVLVATDIAARGIDVEGISHVINFDFPMHPEDYIHRIGRTGRAEAVGDAISFVTADDEEAVRDLEKLTKKSIERKKVDGFDYTDYAPAYPARPQFQRRPAPQGRRPGASSSRPSSGGRPGSPRQHAATPSRPATAARPSRNRV